MERSDLDVVVNFNEAINRRDLEALVGLMTSDHRFVDSEGSVTQGKPSCAAAWASFFESFPDYRNVFESIDLVAPGRVVVAGRSVCEFGPLAGPACWHASVVDGLVSEWRVEDVAAT